MCAELGELGFCVVDDVDRGAFMLLGQYSEDVGYLEAPVAASLRAGGADVVMLERGSTVGRGIQDIDVLGQLLQHLPEGLGAGIPWGTEGFPYIPL